MHARHYSRIRMPPLSHGCSLNCHHGWFDAYCLRVKATVSIPAIELSHPVIGAFAFLRELCAFAVRQLLFTLRASFTSVNPREAT